MNLFVVCYLSQTDKHWSLFQVESFFDSIPQTVTRETEATVQSTWAHLLQFQILVYWSLISSISLSIRSILNKIFMCVCVRKQAAAG